MRTIEALHRSSTGLRERDACSVESEGEESSDADSDREDVEKKDEEQSRRLAVVILMKLQVFRG